MDVNARGHCPVSVENSGFNLLLPLGFVFLLNFVKTTNGRLTFSIF